MMQQWSEHHPLVHPCRFAHTRQTARRWSPALCLVSGRLMGVPSCVRPIQRYYDTVRLLDTEISQVPVKERPLVHRASDCFRSSIPSPWSPLSTLHVCMPFLVRLQRLLGINNSEKYRIGEFSWEGRPLSNTYGQFKVPTLLRNAG